MLTIGATEMYGTATD